MKKKIFLLAISLGVFFNINAQIDINDFSKGNNGVRYKIDKAGNSSRQAKEGDIVIGRLAIYFGDSLGYSTMNTNSEPMFPILESNRMFKGDLMDGLKYARQGDLITFAFPKDSMAGVQGIPAKFNGDYIFYRIAVDSLTTLAEMEQHERLIADSLMKIENTLIDNYLTENKWDNNKVEGIYVKHLQEGNGIKAEEGDIVKIHYVGQLLNGKVFDTSVDSVAKANNMYNRNRKYEPLEFTIGAHQMISGFEIAAKQLKQGGKAIVLLPSQMAYGNRDLGEIKPYSPLLFTIELIEVKKGGKNVVKPKQVQTKQQKNTTKKH